MSETNGAATMADEESQSVSSEDSKDIFLNRTASEWVSVGGYSILGIVLIVFAVLYWDDCSDIYALNYYVVASGIIEILDAVVSFLWRTDKKRELLDENNAEGTITVTDNEAYLAVSIENFLNVVLVGLSIWGAVLVFGNMPWPSTCNRSLFIVAFINIIVTLIGGVYYLPKMFSIYFKK